MEKLPGRSLALGLGEADRPSTPAAHTHTHTQRKLLPTGAWALDPALPHRGGCDTSALTVQPRGLVGPGHRTQQVLAEREGGRVGTRCPGLPGDRLPTPRAAGPRHPKLVASGVCPGKDPVGLQFGEDYLAPIFLRVPDTSLLHLPLPGSLPQGSRVGRLVRSWDRSAPWDTLPGRMSEQQRLEEPVVPPGIGCSPRGPTRHLPSKSI